MKTNDPHTANEPLVSYGKPLTYLDYLKMEYEGILEIIKGKIFKMSAAPSTNHQRICGNLFWLIRTYLKDQKCQIFTAPFDVVLPTNKEDGDSASIVVQPDLCIICDPSKLKDAGCFGPPDLIIEILSKSTTHKDLNNKYNIYEEAGVREYWIVMPLEQLVEVFILVDGKYQRVHTYYEEETMASTIMPDMKIDLREVFAE